jgi:hypothetical protein
MICQHILVNTSHLHNYTKCLIKLQFGNILIDLTVGARTQGILAQQI